MPLSEIWKKSPEQLKGKSVQQVLAFAGDGNLKDGNQTSEEFRELLALVDSDTLSDYANQCLDSPFKDSGIALQDIINQVGNRLGFSVTNGRYRGTAKKEDIGFDGLWIGPDGDALVVEVKTTDAYRMSLDVVALYREALIAKDQIEKRKSSILYIVGRNDTGDLEAQVRGSRHAWDIRLISVEAILRLMKLKEDLDDPQLMEKIRDILTPEEYTRVDRIIELVFSTTREVTKEEVPDEIDSDVDEVPVEKKFTPVKFRQACVDKIEKSLSEILVKRSASIFSTADNSIGISCSISKAYKKASYTGFWFAFHPVQKTKLEEYNTAYVCFGCGSDKDILVIPRDIFLSWLPEFNTTEDDDRFYWHVHVYQTDGKWLFHAKSGQDRIDGTEFYLK